MNTTPTRLLIHGASGRMGQALLRLAAEDSSLQVVAAVVRKPPIQRVIDGIPHFAASELSGTPAFDVAIDFSLPEGFDPVLALCVERGVGLVSGTTGISEVQQAALAAAANKIPLVWATNFSLGVAVLAELVERAAAALPGWDCDIVESHHVHKKDAPSGTALTLGNRPSTAARSRVTPACVQATSSASTSFSSPDLASGWSWCTGLPIGTFSRAGRCMRPSNCASAVRGSIGCGIWFGRPGRPETAECAALSFRNMAFVTTEQLKRGERGAGVGAPLPLQFRLAETR